MAISVGVAKPRGSVNVVGSSGMGVGQAGGGSASSLQPTYSPVKTWNPQQTAPSTVLQNTWNPQQQGTPSQMGSRISSPQVQGTQTSQSMGAAPAQAPDPYAQWGGRAGFNAMQDGFGAQKDVIFGTSRDAANTAGRGIRGGIMDFIESLKAGQMQIDERGIGNELARKQGSAGVMGMVGRGINSGGVMLANKNATSSSATEALARAYGDIGRREMSKVGNQYEMGQREVGMMQDNLGIQRASGIRKIDDGINDSIDGIVANATSSLAQLDSAMLNASMPERIQIEQEKQNIKNEIMGILRQHDGMLSQGVAGVAPKSADAMRAEAFNLSNAGVASPNQFNFTDQVPAQFQNTGPFPTQLPIFTRPRDER